MLKPRLTIFYAATAFLCFIAGGAAAAHYIYGYSSANAGHTLPAWRLLITLAALAAALAAILALLFFRHTKKFIFAPAKHMLQVTERLANGDRYAMVWPARDDELGALGRNIDRLAENFSRLLENIDRRFSEIKNILESIEDAIIVVDSSRKILMLNSAAAEIFGLEKRDWTGAPLMDAARNAEICAEVENAVAQETTREAEINMRPAAKKTVNLRVFPFRNQYDEIDGAVIVVRDVTRLKKLETMRTEFIESASHELRTPVSLIRGFVETLLGGAADEEKSRARFLVLLDKESRRLMSLTEDILALEQAESLHARRDPVEFDPAAELRELLKAFEHRITDKQLVIETAFPAEPFSLVMPPQDFTRIFTNLIDNAVKFTDSGKISVSASAAGGRAVFRVADTGDGIPEEHLDRLFERFYRVDKSRSRARGGTGLGLSIVKHLAENNRGSVSVESESGRGAVFTVELPLGGEPPG